MALKGMGDLYRAQDARILLEMILLGNLNQLPRIQNLLSFAGASGTAVAATPPLAHTTIPATSATPVKAVAQTALASYDEKWNGFVDRVRKVNGLIAAKLDQVHLLNMNELEAIIGIPEKYKFLYSQIADDGFQKKLVNYNTFWGPGHSVQIKMIDPEQGSSLSPTKLQEKKIMNEKEQLTKQVEDHPLVKQAKSLFNTQIKSIREN